MKSRTLKWIAKTILFAVLALPTRVSAQTHHHYKLIDLGTFGGPESYINPAFTFGSPNQINRQGAVVGGAGTTIPVTPTSNGFVCGGLDGSVPFVNHAFQWRDGDLDDLGAIPGGDNCSVATSINARGEIAGTSENGAFDPSLGLNELRAVVWKNGSNIRDLGTFGGHLSLAVGINKRGQVAGAATNATPDPFSLLYQLAGSPNGTQSRAFLWDNEMLHDLGTLGGPDAVAVALNDNGQVAGFSYTNSTPNVGTGLPTIHPFVWSRDGGMKDLGSLGGTLAGPWAPAMKPTSESGGFNNRGQFIGIATVAGDQTSDPFLWDGEKRIDLFTETTGGNPLSAAGINDAGEVVGGAAFPNRTVDAYLWRNGVATDLGTVDGDSCSWARAINSQGQVVGQSFACDGSINTLRAFLWEDGSIVDLNKLIPGSSQMQLVDPVSINDRGEIAGIGLPPGCTLFEDATCGHAFVLIPCDENHPNIEDCDYSLVEASAMVNVATRMPGANMPATASSGVSPEVIRQLLQSVGSTPWRRRFGAQPQR